MTPPAVEALQSSSTALVSYIACVTAPALFATVAETEAETEVEI